MKNKKNKEDSALLEIGGFFEFPEFDNITYEQSVLFYLRSIDRDQFFFRDGRQAIKSALLRVENPKNKICYLPSYLCHSVLQSFEELDLKVEFYDYRCPLKLLMRKNIANSIIFIIDYFGTEIDLKEILDKGNIVILDVSHSLLDKSRLGIKNKNLYTVASLRKIFPIPDGGILYCSDSRVASKMVFPEGYEPMVEMMRLKKAYLNGKSALASKKIKNFFLETYKRYENNKDSKFIELQDIPAVSLEIMRKISISNIATRRKANLDFLYKSILNKTRFLFSFGEIKSPFALPLVFESGRERDNVKKKLISNNIYPPVHWDLGEFVPKSYSFEHRLCKRILSMPIDQRYSARDLSRLVNALNSNL